MEGTETSEASFIFSSTISLKMQRMRWLNMMFLLQNWTVIVFQILALLSHNEFLHRIKKRVLQSNLIDLFNMIFVVVENCILVLWFSQLFNFSLHKFKYLGERFSFIFLMLYSQKKIYSFFYKKIFSQRKIEILQIFTPLFTRWCGKIQIIILTWIYTQYARSVLTSPREIRTHSRLLFHLNLRERL